MAIELASRIFLNLELEDEEDAILMNTMETDIWAFGMTIYVSKHIIAIR